MRYVEIPLREDGTAFLAAYLLDPNIRHQQRKERPAMLICPGGAYLTLAAKEGEPVAARWLGMGYQAFVVHYKHYVVDPGETLAFFRELQKAVVPCELHFYERGPHGTSLCDWSTAAYEDDMVPQNAAWVEACKRWLDLDME